MSSGYIPASSSAWTSGGSPVSTELVDRLADNPYKVAADRLNAIFSMVLPLEEANRGLFKNDATGVQGSLMTKIPLPTKFFELKPFVPPKVRIWAYVERTGDATASVTVNIGDRAVSLPTGYGILQATLELQGSEFSAWYQPSQVMLMKVGGTGYVALRTLQVLEEKVTYWPPLDSRPFCLLFPP